MTNFGHIVRVSPKLQTLRSYLEESAGLLDDSEVGIKRRRILDAAAARFVERGYKKTSIEDIARAANIGKGTVYLYFSSKNELIIAAIAREKLALFDRMAPFFESQGEGRTRLKAWILLTFELAQDMPLATAILQGDEDYAALMAEMPPALLQQSKVLRMQLLGELIAQTAAPRKLAPHEIEDRLVVLASLINLSISRLDMISALGCPPTRYASILADMVVDGLAHPDPKSKITPPPSPPSDHSAKLDVEP